MVTKIISVAILAAVSLAAQQAAVTLRTSANPVQFGQPLTMTATVAPSSASGKVTFYDGTTVLGIRSLAGGQAVFTTSLLATGVRSLKAYYGGITSAAVPQTVMSLAATGFLPAGSYPAGGSFSLTVGDFNGDGKADCIMVVPTGVAVVLGNGDGTFQAPIVTTAVSVSRLALGDFNGDGKTDVAFTTSLNTVGVMLGNGDGTFQAPVTYKLTVGSIVVGDFNGDGQADLAITNGSVNILLGNGDGSFRTALNTNPGNYAVLSVVGDFNADGIADLAVAGSTLEVLQGRGDGTFQLLPGSYPIGNAPSAIALGDFNGDGKADLVLTSYTSAVNVLLGNGDGTFQSPSNTILGSNAAGTGVAIGDVNGDGKADIVLSTIAPSQVAPFGVVLYGNGDGTFQATNYALPGFAGSVVIADFNGDGKVDAVFSYLSLAVLLGELRPVTSTALTSSLNPSKQGQTITLTATVSPSAATGSVTFYDGVTQLGGNALVNSQASLTVTSLALGSHSLTAVYSGDTQYVTSTSVVVTQVVSGVLPAPTITLSSSANPARYGQAISLTATASPSSATGKVTFYDGTSVLEIKPLVSGHATLTTGLLGSGVHSLTAYYGGDATNAPSRSAVLALLVNVPAVAYGFLPANNLATHLPVLYDVAAGDFNGDGKADLVVVNYVGGSYQTSQVSVLLGKGDGTFQTAVNYPAGGYATSVTVGDWNGDGIQDLVLGNGYVFLGNGDGTFRQGVTAFSGLALSVAVADFNGDGKADLAVPSSTAYGFVSILLGNGDGTFQTPLAYSVGTGVDAVSTGDFNGDGKADLAVTSSQNSTMSILLGNGDGTFRTAVSYAAGSGANYVAVSDFNGDGKADLAVPNGVAGTIGVYLGNGDGTFQAAVNYPDPSDPIYIVAVDLNGDGKMDLAVAGFYGDFEVLLGNGDGTFQTPASLPAGMNPKALAAADFNGDGMPDLAVANYGDSTVSILLGTGGAHLQFVPTPNVPAGAVIPAVLVQEVDSLGHALTGAYVPITLTSVPAGIRTTAAPVNGSVVFAGLQIDLTGSYTLTASGTGFATVSETFNVVASLPTVVIDSPEAGAVIPAGPTLISGWALDNVNLVGTAISSVNVLLDGTMVGTATYGINRPDACAVYPLRPGCPNVGFTFTLNLPPGMHTISVMATDSDPVPDSSTTSVTVTASGEMTGTRTGVFRNNMSFLEDTNGDGVYEAGTDRFIANFTGPGGFVAGDVPVAGDWTGDGHAKVGIYRASTGQWFLDANNDGVFNAGDYTYSFGGLAGDMPFVGDWSGLGKSCVGIYRSVGSVWLLDLNCNGNFENTPTDAFFPFGGIAGDVPVVGAWTGGATRVGVVRKYAPGGVPQGNPFYWVLDGAAANAGNLPANHPPAANAFGFGGLGGDMFVTGDWYGTGVSGAGVYRAGFWVLDAASPGAPQAYHVPGLTFGYGGLAGDLPISGKW